MAITSFISRHLFCKLGDFRFFDRFHLYQGGMTFSGLCMLCLPLARSFSSVVVIFMMFGLMEGSGAHTGQASLLVLECVGKHKVNQAWGYIRLFTGLSVVIGPPLAGKFILLCDLVESLIGKRGAMAKRLVRWTPDRNARAMLCCVLGQDALSFPSPNRGPFVGPGNFSGP